jgi:hypothetical protein
MIERAVFGCLHCGAVFTPPLRRLPAWLDEDPGYAACTEVPTGTWSPRAEPGGRPDHPVAVSVIDARGLVLHEEHRRIVGCCGVGYRAGLPNLRCARCRREVAFRLSDGDHCRHAVFVSATPLATSLHDEPDDEALRARFACRLAAAGEPPPDAGMDALPDRLRVQPDSLWEDDVQRVDVFPELRDLAVSVTGTEVRVALDGVWIRPPWPAPERDRSIALEQVSAARDDEPLTWWADVVGPHGSRDRHEWTAWRVGGSLCAGWRRARGARFEDTPQIAFRAPWELWELAWREALAR